VATKRSDAVMLYPEAFRWASCTVARTKLGCRTIEGKQWCACGKLCRIPSSCEGARADCLCAGALTDSAVGQASIERANRIPANSVPEGYATTLTHTHTHTHCSLFSLLYLCLSVCVYVCRRAHPYMSVSVCHSIRARAHTQKPYQSIQTLQSSGSTACNSAPLRRITRQHTSNHFDLVTQVCLLFLLYPPSHAPVGKQAASRK
jgi:hypothetical protein